MVKNLGGNKAKRQGRKHAQPGHAQSTRRAATDDEVYGIVTKMFGNGRAEVRSIDGATRTMIIRKKFKGRNKRDNTVALNTWVLVGLRSWEVRKADDKETCDLLEVYNGGDVDELKQSVDAPWSVLTTAARSNQTDDGDGTDIRFVDERTQKYEDLLGAEGGTDAADALDWLAGDGADDDFDIDDL